MSLWLWHKKKVYLLSPLKLSINTIVIQTVYATAEIIIVFPFYSTGEALLTVLINVEK